MLDGDGSAADHHPIAALSAGARGSVEYLTFRTRVFDDLPQLEQLIETGARHAFSMAARLDGAGHGARHTIGPWLASQSVMRDDSTKRLTTTLRTDCRGRLASCNYDLHVLPDSRSGETRWRRCAERADLRRFVAWAREAAGRSRSVHAVGRRFWFASNYVDASTISHAPNVQRVAIETNLSSNLRGYRVRTATPCA